jgi:hypothetical protein
MASAQLSADVRRVITHARDVLHGRNLDAVHASQVIAEALRIDLEQAGKFRAKHFAASKRTDAALQQALSAAHVTIVNRAERTGRSYRGTSVLFAPASSQHRPRSSWRAVDLTEYA